MYTLRVLTIVMLTVLFAAPSAFAQTDAPDGRTPVSQPATDEERTAVSFLLSAYHELPPKAEFERVARDPIPILRHIAERGSGLKAVRAMEALFMWPSDDVFVFAVSTLESADTRSTTKHRLMMLLARTFAARAIDAVGPFLEHDDRALRITAAAALSRIHTPEAFALIDAAVAGEESAAVAAEMQRYSRRIASDDGAAK